VVFGWQTGNGNGNENGLLRESMVGFIYRILFGWTKQWRIIIINGESRILTLGMPPKKIYI